MNLKRSLLLLAVTLFAGIASISGQVKTDYDHSANFQSYKTYSWIKVQTGNSLWDTRLQQAVDAELTGKGWSKVPSGGSATVAAFRKTHDEQSLQTYYDGFGGGWGWRGFGNQGFSTTNTITTEVGNVVVDIFDGQTKKLLWRATDSADLSSNADKNIGKLQKDVRDMFKRFPPR